MSAGERNLERLLANLEPQLCAERYAFAPGSETSLEPGVFAIIREEEGFTVIQSDPAGEWARISLGVHSSLEAVGLTAALSRALADAAISANIVAALHHDHLFVPWNRREQALDCLRALSANPPFA